MIVKDPDFIFEGQKVDLHGFEHDEFIEEHMEYVKKDGYYLQRNMPVTKDQENEKGPETSEDDQAGG